MRIPHTSLKLSSISSCSNGLCSTITRRPCMVNGSVSSHVQDQRRKLLTLAIETSCDDTCVAVLRKARRGMAKLLYHKKITSDNREFGGVHPAKAVIGHSQTLGPVVRDAVRNGLHGEIPDFITVTRGPGMNQNLAVGLNTAKGLAAAWNIPLLGVNHMQAHALTPRLITALDRYLPGSSHAYMTGQQNGVQDVGHPSWVEAEEGLMLREGRKLTLSEPRYKARVDELPKEPRFPYLSLLVSGGHTMLVISESVTTHRILVPNLSGLALGDMLDKAARVLVPQDVLDQSPDTNYAAILESFAFPNKGDIGYGYEPPATRADEIAPLPVEVHGEGVITTLTPPLAGTRRLAYDFAGLGTQVKQKAQEVLLRYETMPSSEISKSDPSPEAKMLNNRILDARRALARATMRLAFEHLASRILFVLAGGENLHPDTRAILPNVETLVVSGGVARNKYLNHILRSTLDARGHGSIDIATPPPPFCTDNAAMIAWCGAEMWEEGWRSEMDVLPLKKWPIDPSEEGGILGASGWVPRDGKDKEL